MVTGADGFIGAALIDYLQSQADYEGVRCVRPGSTRTGDLTYDLVDARVPDMQGIDVVVHAAARVHVMRDRTIDPLAAFRAANVEGTLRLAKAAAKAGVRRFVFLSSIAVNGNATLSNQAFSAGDPAAPHDAYGVSKFEAEQALLALATETAFEVVIVRPTLVYGAGAAGNVRQMLKWLRMGVPLPLAGIHNRRSFVSLYNLVDFLALCVRHPDAAGEVFLVADPDPVSTPGLLSALAAGMGRSPRLFWFPERWLRAIAVLIGRRQWADRLFGSLVVDTKKNSQLLGWRAPQSFAEGISLTVQTPTRNVFE